MEIFTFLWIALGLNLVMFLIAYLAKTDVLTDISYATTFILLALWAFVSNEGGELQAVVLALILVWALRIGGYLLMRIMHMKSDKRFDGIRESFGKFAFFWIFQGVTVWIILLPALYVLGHGHGHEIENLSLIGIAIWVTGLLLEAIADHQKFTFKNKYPTKFISTGLWKYSRHPNYFGEILCWIGIYVVALPMLVAPDWIYALASPLYITIILCLFSGIPPLEKRYQKKFGKEKKYQEYKKTTSILIPWKKKSQ